VSAVVKREHREVALSLLGEADRKLIERDERFVAWLNHEVGAPIGFLSEVDLDDVAELLAGLEQATEARVRRGQSLDAWAMCVLDAWRAAAPMTRDWTMHSSRNLFDGKPLCWVYDRAVNGDPSVLLGSNYAGTNEVEARVAAARALKATHPELGEEEPRP
jgi:hypothetical protein